MARSSFFSLLFFSIFLVIVVDIRVFWFVFSRDALDYGATTATTIATEHLQFYKYSGLKKQQKKSQFKTFPAPTRLVYDLFAQTCSHDWPVCKRRPSQRLYSFAGNQSSILAEILHKQTCSWA